MSFNTCCRWVTVRSTRSAMRTAVRSAVHSCKRSAIHRARRDVLKDRGPTLREVCALLNSAIETSEAYRKKYHPAWNEGRFKMLRPPAESHQQGAIDLERIYGDNTDAAREIEAFAAAASAQPRSQQAPDAAPPKPPLPTATTPPAPWPKSDLIAVPLMRLPSGILTCDYSKARPA